MHRDLGVLGAGLDAQVPAGAGRVERVAGGRGSPEGPLGLEAAAEQRHLRGVGAAGVDERAASPKRSRPSASRKSPGPNPMVTVSPPGGRPIASPVSSGGRFVAPPTAPIGPASSPCVIRSAASVQRRRRSTSAARSSVMTSKAAKCRRSCAGVVMPAWCTPRNGYDAATWPAEPTDPAGDS